MRSVLTRNAHRRAAAVTAVAGGVLLATAGVASAAESSVSAAASARAPQKVTAVSGHRVAAPTSKKIVVRAADLRTTFNHTEYRSRRGGYELARTYADQALAVAPNCAAYAGIGQTTSFLSRVGARRPSVATPILVALSPIYKFANWLAGRFFTPPCELAKQLAKSASVIAGVSYWEGEVYHKVHILKDTRFMRVDLCRFNAYTYYRVRGQWYIVQTMNAHLPARGDWSDCRP